MTAFKTTIGGIKEEPQPIYSVLVTDAEQAQLAIDFLANTDKTTYVVCNNQDINNQVYYIWDGDQWISMSTGLPNDRVVSLDFGLSGIYSQGGVNFMSIPLQVLIAQILTIGAFTKVEGKLQVSYNTTGNCSGEMQLRNFTDGVVIAGTLVVLPDTNGVVSYLAGGWVDLTSVEGKAVRMSMKRVGVPGNVNVRGINLLLKFN